MGLRIRVSAFFGALAILLGAFGAHIASHKLSESAYEIYRTASQYHLIHAVFLFAALQWKCRNSTYYLILAGTCLFSGSLYIYSCMPVHFLVFLTPIGGLLMVAGWLSLLAGPENAGQSR
ncbi:MAG: DUF423 domain-containing protein [Candidatus Omnitrophica bacterium]|nr:DUF423 domain-containing protein [Candidatus Omnitrophota bacterium]